MSITVFPSRVFKKSFRVTLLTDPVALGTGSPKFVNVLLGAKGSAGTSAVLEDFVFQGGDVSPLFATESAIGEFRSVIRMKCGAGLPTPQVLGHMSADLARMDFTLRIRTTCLKHDRFTLWLGEIGGVGLPSKAAGCRGLFASVSWTPEGVFETAGYAGDHDITGGRNATGFSATVTAIDAVAEAAVAVG